MINNSFNTVRIIIMLHKFSKGLNKALTVRMMYKLKTESIKIKGLFEATTILHDEVHASV